MGNCIQPAPIQSDYDKTAITESPKTNKHIPNPKIPKPPITTIPHYPNHIPIHKMQSIDEMKNVEDELDPINAPMQIHMQQSILTNDEEEEEFRMSEVCLHNKVNDLWIVLNNNVYDVTNFWQQHPVNPQYVFKYGGQDATDAFNAAGHSNYAEKLANQMKIGVLSIDCKNHLLKKQVSVVNWHNLENINLEHEITIKHINVYPVKGCRGVELQSTWIDQSGVFNDRMYVFVDADTHNPINQLKYPKLALIQPVLKNIDDSEDNHYIKLYYFDKNGSKNLIKVKSKYDKNKMIHIEYVNSDTKILGYDQGDEISEWITNYLHLTTDIKDKNKTFRFCKIARENVRHHIDYFSLPFTDKKDQPIKGVLNYSAINLASQESMNELNRRWLSKDSKNEAFEWDRWRVNIILTGLPAPHYEDFAKFISIGPDVQLLWNRRRYLCTVPSVNQSIGLQTNEPQQTLTRYRNATTLNDTTAKPGTNGVFFGSFFLVKQGGEIRVGESVDFHQTQFNILRTNRQTSFYGCGNVVEGDKNFLVKTLTQYNPYKLIKKEPLTNDVYHLRFALADDSAIQHESLRLNIGGHYLLKIPNSVYDDEKSNSNEISVIRAYTPIVFDNKNDDESFFDLVVKIYAKGKMTQFFKRMNVGDLIDGKQYYGGIRYIEIGTFRFGDPSHYQVKHWSVNTKYINMICGGTGICPMMQIIQFINLNKEIDNTKINILYSNKTINDILLMDELNEIVNNNENINIYYVITTKENKSEKKKIKNKYKDLKITSFGKRINVDFINKYGYPVSDDCIALLCGPPKMDIAMNECCKKIGFDEKHIHTF